MTAPPTATPTAPGHRDPALHPATPAQLHWLEGELRPLAGRGAARPRPRAGHPRALRRQPPVHALADRAHPRRLLRRPRPGLAGRRRTSTPCRRCARFLLMVAVWLGLVVAVRAAGRAGARGRATRLPGRRGRAPARRRAPSAPSSSRRPRACRCRPTSRSSSASGASVRCSGRTPCAASRRSCSPSACWPSGSSGRCSSAGDGPSPCRPRSAAAALAARVRRGAATCVLGWRDLADPVARGRRRPRARRPCSSPPCPTRGARPRAASPSGVGLGLAVVLAAWPLVRGDRVDRLEVGLAALAAGADGRAVAVAVRRGRLRHGRPAAGAGCAPCSSVARLPRRRERVRRARRDARLLRGSPGSPRRRWSCS